MKAFYKKIIIGALITSFAFIVFGFSVPEITQAFASPAMVDLLSAGNFTVLAKSQITTTGATLISGDIGISPAAATFIQGFSLTADPSK